MARSPLICTIAPLCIYGGYFFRRSKISGISFLYGFLDSGDLPEFPFNKFTHSLIYQEAAGTACSLCEAGELAEKSGICPDRDD